MKETSPFNFDVSVLTFQGEVSITVGIPTDDPNEIQVDVTPFTTTIFWRQPGHPVRIRNIPTVEVDTTDPQARLNNGVLDILLKKK